MLLLKLRFLLIFLVLVPLSYSQEHLTLYYFGASNCGPCNRPEVIESIKSIKEKFPELHTEYKTKFVMICMDENIEEGLKFINKYGFWDEISIGSFYHNELALSILNKAEIPGVPHIFIYKETYEEANYGVELRKSQELIKEITGGDQIVNWVSAGMKLKE